MMMMMMMMIEQSLRNVSEVEDLLEKSLVENIHTGVQQSTFGWMIALPSPSSLTLGYMIALPSSNSQIALDGKVQISTLIPRREALSTSGAQNSDTGNMEIGFCLVEHFNIIDEPKFGFGKSSASELWCKQGLVQKESSAGAHLKTCKYKYKNEKYKYKIKVLVLNTSGLQEASSGAK